MKKNIISFVFFVILTSCLANVTRHDFMPKNHYMVIGV